MLQLTAYSAVLLWASIAGGWYGAPSGPPEQAVLTMRSGGALELSRYTVQLVPESREREVPYQVSKRVPVTVERDGQQVTEYKEVTETQTRKEVYTVIKPIHKTYAQKLGPETSFYELDGRKVATETLATRLPADQPTPIVVTRDGQPLPKHYAWVFKPGTLVLAMTGHGDMPPATGGPYSGGPGPDESHMRFVSQPAPSPAPKDSPASAFPKTPPPELLFASLKEDGQLSLRRYTEQTSERKVAVALGSGQDLVQKEIVVQDVNLKSQITRLDRRYAQFYTAAGSRVSDVDSALRQEIPALVADFKPVDPFWVRNIKPSVLVVIVPSQVLMPNFGGGYGGPYMSAPFPFPVPQDAPRPQVEGGAVDASPPPPPKPVPLPPQA